MKSLRIYAYIGAVLLFLIITILYFAYRINDAMYYEDAQNSIDEAMQTTQELISHQKDLALTISTLLAQKEQILSAYTQNDRKKLFDVALEEIKHLKNTVGIESLDIQFHTKNLDSFVRSWDFASQEQNLSSFRKGLNIVKKTGKSIVSIELGKRLNIKAISPIKIKNVYVGSVEVIMGFDDIEQKLRKKGINFIVLMKEEYLQIAAWMRERPHIGGYVLASKECMEGCDSILDSLIKQGGDTQGFAAYENYFFGFAPIYDLDYKELGLIAIWFEKNMLKDSLLLRKRGDEYRLEKNDAYLFEGKKNNGIEIR